MKSLGEKSGFQLWFQLNFEAKNVISNYEMFFFNLKWCFQLLTKIVDNVESKPTTDSKPTYTCEFFNQHWNDKILVGSDKPF
jgi:hypothetical protein